ncbi:ribonuclease-like [Elgaria multicarinata webbii]|uniref:ribonuclease-like n=1 Tax=Elgaria multicarinata webbii TaxID=159646 RepID=UPI002FCCBEE5
MSPKGLRPQAFLLLLFLMATTLLPRSEGTSSGDTKLPRSEGTVSDEPQLPGSQDSSFREFLKRHLDSPKSDYQNDHTYCNLMMSRRNLNCQRGNTFIHSSERQLTAICNSAKRNLDGNQTSRTLFPITICRLAEGRKGLYCRYTGKSEIKKIRVTCKNGLPVHYIAHA